MKKLKNMKGVKIMTDICRIPTKGTNTITLTQGGGTLRRTDVNFNYDGTDKAWALSHQKYRATDFKSPDTKFYAPCKIRKIFHGVHEAYSKYVNIAIFETIEPVKCADNIIRDLTFVCVHGGLNIPSGTIFNTGDHFYTQGSEGMKEPADHMHIDILAGKVSNDGVFSAAKFDAVHDKYSQPYGFNEPVAGLLPEKSLNFDDVFAFPTINTLKYEDGVAWKPYLTLKTINNVQNCTTNGWVKEYNVDYLYRNGIKQTGWKQDSSGSWYFLDYTNGHMHTGWIASGSKWYFCNPANGIMQTGWIKVDGIIYYMDPNDGGAMVTGIKIINGVRYSFNTSGALTGNAPSGVSIPEYSISEE